MSTRKFIIGIDEVGVGAIAGPLTICACYIPSEHWQPLRDWGFTDSKRMTEKKRLALCNRLLAEANGLGVKWAFASVEPIHIDSMGPMPAEFRAARTAYLLLVKQLEVALEDTAVIMDGQYTLPNLPKSIEQIAVPKADAFYAPVSVASCLAKTHRDNELKALGRAFPNYEFEKNKGYPTIEHASHLWQRGPLYGIHRAHYLKKTVVNYYNKHLADKCLDIPKWIDSEWLNLTNNKLPLYEPRQVEQ
jgi:ribonuclease HII